MSDVPEIILDEAGIRSLAQHELQYAFEAEKQLLSEHASAFRWLTASLLAVNGGSALALFSSSLDPPTKLIAGAAFFIGAFCALLCGYLSQAAARGMMQPLRNFKYYWILVEQTGNLNLETQAVVARRVKKAAKGGWPSRLTGWLSASAFVLGVVWIGWAVWSIPPVGSNAAGWILPPSCRLPLTPPTSVEPAK